MANLALPRYLRWRDGRPRWELGGKGGSELVKAGFRSRDLKDRAGQWLGLEAAIAEAARLNRQVDAWRRGEDVQAGGADPAEGSAVRPKGRLTIADMLDAYEKSPGFLGKARATQRVYRVYAGTLRKWLGDLEPGSIQPQDAAKLFDRLLDVAHWKEERRAAGDRRANHVWHDHFLLLPRAQREAVTARREEAMEEGEGQPKGYSAAFYTCAHMHLVWDWSRAGLGLQAPNPFARMGLASPDGRVREISPDELAHLVATAEAMGRPDVADAFVIGVLTCQRRIDMCRLGWRIRETGRVQLVQQKTGRPVDFRAPAQLMERLDASWARQKAAGTLRPDRILVTPSGSPYDYQPNVLSGYVREVRQKAAETMPSCADIVLHDARDTGVTWLFRSGLDLVRVCEISGHSLTDAETIKKAYLKSNPELADQATDAMDAWLARKGHKF